MKDLRRTVAPAPDSTGFHSAPAFGEGAQRGAEAWLVAERGGGLQAGERFDLIGGLSIGRSKESDAQIEDRYASGVHARIFSREGRHFIEDMDSTNGTLLNDASLKGEAELIDGDVVENRGHWVSLRGACVAILIRGCLGAAGERTGVPQRHGAPAQRQ